MNGESRPQGAAPKTAAKLSEIHDTAPAGRGLVITDLELLDALLHAHIVGYELGLAERFEREVEDAVQARLHQRWLHGRQLAYDQALANHGPAWAEMIWQAAS